MIKLKEAVIVEGKYDKIRVESVIDAPIITTGGFSIFNDREKQRFIRRLANERGIIVLTDSDSAGFMIRSKICSIVPPDKVKNVYIPELHGKEKRKNQPSKEGLLGVEGVDNQIIVDALKRAGIVTDDGATGNSGDNVREPITRSDLYELGLNGGENSSKKRQKLLKKLDFPSKMSTNSMLAALNIFITREELAELCKEL